jgi:hypothetical protein
MTMNRAPVATTYFLVPGWKDEDFADEVGLGNIILDHRAPHVSICTLGAHDPVLALDKAAKTKEVTDRTCHWGREEEENWPVCEDFGADQCGVKPLAHEIRRRQREVHC